MLAESPLQDAVGLPLMLLVVAVLSAVVLVAVVLGRR